MWCPNLFMVLRGVYSGRSDGSGIEGCRGVETRFKCSGRQMDAGKSRVNNQAAD